VQLLLGVNPHVYASEKVREKWIDLGSLRS